MNFQWLPHHAQKELIEVSKFRPLQTLLISATYREPFIFLKIHGQQKNCHPLNWSLNKRCWVSWSGMIIPQSYFLFKPFIISQLTRNKYFVTASKIFYPSLSRSRDGALDDKQRRKKCTTKLTSANFISTTKYDTSISGWHLLSAPILLYEYQDNYLHPYANTKLSKI